MWVLDKKVNALKSSGVVGKEKVILLMPQGFMNNSGKSLKDLAGSPKKIEKCVVVYDDMDLALGTMKISFGRGDGGHNGIASVIKHLRSKDFPRIRIGISPATPTGKLKKPTGEKDVLAHILGPFKEKEEEVLKKQSKEVVAALETLIEKGRAEAMNQYN